MFLRAWWSYRTTHPFGLQGGGRSGAPSTLLGRIIVMIVDGQLRTQPFRGE